MINRRSMAFEKLAPSIYSPLQLSMLQALPKSGTAKNTGLPLPANHFSPILQFHVPETLSQETVVQNLGTLYNSPQL